MNFEKYTAQIFDYFSIYGTKVLLALVVLIVGIMIINRLTRLTGKIMKRNQLDISLSSFLVSLINILLKALLIISVASMVGIETTSFVAIIGAAGLAVGLALQGTLANFAGGVLILIFKPYKVGDLIETQGYTGNVKEIQIFVTVLLTPENKTVIIPNGAISNGSITNYTTQGIIRVDLTMGISYSADIKQAKSVLIEAMQKHPKVLKNPEPFVGVSELGESAVKLAVRPYSKPEDYWTVYFDIYEQAKVALNQAHIEIPFPQMEVLMKNSK